MSSQSSSSSNSSDPTITDADDSIVLSDLVRTGEASRLRRRGAMRLDHGFTNHSNDSNPGPNLSAIFSSQPSRVHQSTSRGLNARMGDRNGDSQAVVPQTEMQLKKRDPEEEEYILFCGGEEILLGPAPPFEPSILPLFPSPRSRWPARGSKRSTGCGAVIHAYASPCRRLGVWTAKSAATDIVVGMDTSYFDRAAVAKIVKSACGCVREGVGCAVWCVT